MPYFPLCLKESLSRILKYPLTLIEADSGCGKSTAVNSYFFPVIAKGYRQYLYTSLGESAEKSWNVFCRLLGNVDSQAAHYLESLGIPDSDTISETAYQISNLICDKPAVLCLDNFQLMEFPEKRLLLQALSLHRCPNLHFVVITQPFDKPEHGTSFFSPGIFRIGAETLMFSKEDIHMFFQKEGVHLSANHLDQVWKTTEGLTAAVSLQLESWKYNGRFESSEKISDLMETALWNHLSPQEQTCLVRLSVLNSFTMRQAMLMNNGGMSQTEITYLFHKTHFIRFVDTYRLYHLHYLLRTFLTERFHLLSDGEQTQILRLAAHTCAQEKDYIRSAMFYGRIKDYDALLSLPFSTHDWIELISQEKSEVLEDLASPAYCNRLLKYPELAVLFSFELYIRGNMVLHRQYLEVVRRILKRRDCYEYRRYQRLQGEYTLIQSFLVFNDVEKMSVYHRDAVSLLQGPTRLLTRHGCWTFASPSVVSLYWRESGKLQQELRAVQTSMPDYYSLTNGNGRGAPGVMEAEILLLQGEDKRAFALFRQAVYEAEQYEQVCICYCARFGMARLALLQGNCASFMHMREKINDMAYEGTESSRVFTTTLCEAYFHILLGEYEEIPRWFYHDAALRRKTFIFALPFAHIIKGRLLLEECLDGKISSAEFEETIVLYMQECENVHMLLPKLYYEIYLAVCREYAGRTKEAIDTFREALSLAAADKVWLPLAEYYEKLQPVMMKMAARREETHLLKWTEELGRRYQTGIKKVQKQLHPQKTSLTPREKEVAVLLKQRYSIKEIAEKLVISPSTVSNTMQKVYSKLEIHSKKELYSRGDI